MKVLSIIGVGHEQGGAETSLVAYRKVFRGLGHEVRVISSNLHPDVPHYSDYEFDAIPSKGIGKITNSIFNVSAYRVTRKVLKEYRPDVVLLHTMHQITPAPLFLLRKHRAILCVHGPEPFTTSLLPWYFKSSWFKNGDYDTSQMTLAGRFGYWAHRRPYRLLYAAGLRNVDRFLVFSAYIKQIMRQDGFDPQQMSHIRQGVKPMTATREATPASEPTIVYVGRLEKVKGVDDLVAAMPEVLKQSPNARLVVAGDGSYAQELQRQASRLGIEGSVAFLGNISHSEVGSLYAESLATVMPSVWPEPFGKVGVEAMSVGAPVIATDVGGIREWLRDNENGILVPAGQPQKIADAIIRLIREPELRASLSSNARKTVHEFSLDRFTANFLEVVSQVAADMPCAASYE